MAKIKKNVTPNAGEDAQEVDLSYVAGGNAKWYIQGGNGLLLSYKWNMQLSYNPEIVLLEICPTEMKT